MTIRARHNAFYIYIIHACYLDEVRSRLHRACPVMSPLCNSYIPHQEVRGQVTGSKGMVSGLQQRETGDASGAALLFVDHQPVGMETPAGVQVEVKHWEEGQEKWPQ